MSVQVTSIEAYVEVNTTEAVVNIVPIGEQGIPGEGVPIGGTTGQVLAKASNTDYDTAWVTGGGGGGGVQSVTGDGVGGTAEDVVLTFPTPAEIGAYPDNNPDGFVDSAGASSAAPVQSVNGDTGTVVLDASDVGAYPDTNPSNFIDASGAPVQSVNGDTGTVVLDYADVGADPVWTTTTANSGTLTGLQVVWLADTTASRNRTLDATGIRLQVKDTTGSAGTNNITLTAPSGQTINGNATEIIDVNFGWVEYVRSGTNWVTIGGQA
jgi:hypothetical protein